MAERIERIAIIGGGPAGATLGAALARAGRRAVIFDPDRRPDLIVGESLVPAIVPYMRELGVEEEVKSFSVFKPGATIWLGKHGEVSFDFALGGGRLPSYSYNTPRDLFDAALLRAAERAGVKVIKQTARLELEGQGGVRLANESLEAAREALGGAPDFIADASGRARVVSRLLGIPAIEGGRRDSALFAHWEGVELTRPGDIHVDRHDRGWGWRIPLPGRVSIGIVVDPAHLQAGATTEEAYDAFVASEPHLRETAGRARRVSGVMKYNNYQLVSNVMTGPGWALAGDAAGFLDPIFSTGLYLSLRGASTLAQAILNGNPSAFRNYQGAYRRELAVWKRIVEYWYDGRLFTLFRVGRDKRDTAIGRFMDPHMTKHITRIFTGEAARAPYSRALLHFMIKHSLLDYDPADLKIY